MNLWYLLVAVVLLLANGFFVGAEFALTAARRTRLEQLAEEGSARAGMAVKSARELSLMLAGAQLGITMASLGLGFVAEPAVADFIESGFESIGSIPEGVLHPLSFAVALTIIVFFHMVVGEMAPKNIAIAQPEKSALALAVPFRLYVNLFRPVVNFLNTLANGGLRLLGVEPRDEILTAHTSEEIRSMIETSAEQGLLAGYEHRLLAGAIEFAERDAGAVMTPRTDMLAFPHTITATELEGVIMETGKSRFPVYEDVLDHVLGFVHAKDLLRLAPAERDRPIPRALMRDLLVVPESRKLDELLFDMRRERQHVALVVDEHGGTAGVVTLDDVLEEIVGEIRDEYDVGELGIERLAQDRFLVPGGLRIDEAAEHIGMNLPEGDYETVAGFLMDRLGRIPGRRDLVRHDGWRLRVRSMKRHRVVQVLIERDPTFVAAARSDPHADIEHKARRRG